MNCAGGKTERGGQQQDGGVCSAGSKVLQSRGLCTTVQLGPMTARAHMGKQCACAWRVGGGAGWWLARGERRRRGEVGRAQTLRWGVSYGFSQEGEGWI